MDPALQLATLEELYDEMRLLMLVPEQPDLVAVVALASFIAGAAVDVMLSLAVSSSSLMAMPISLAQHHQSCW